MKRIVFTFALWVVWLFVWSWYVYLAPGVPGDGVATAPEAFGIVIGLGGGLIIGGGFLIGFIDKWWNK